MKKRMKRAVKKNNFSRNFFLITGAFILVVLVAYFIIIRSNMTGNAACTLNEPRNVAGNCYTSDCYFGTKIQICTRIIGTWYYWRNSCQKSLYLCQAGQTCSSGECRGTPTPTPSGSSSSATCISIGNTGCSASSLPCCDGTCTNSKCCFANGISASSASYCCSGYKDYVDKCANRPSGTWSSWSCGDCSSTCLKTCTRYCGSISGCPADGYGTTKSDTCTGGACPTSSSCVPACPTAATTTCGVTTAVMASGCPGITCPAVTGRAKNCGTKVCGSDSCGNSCGKCSGFTYCDNGQCARL